MGTRCARYSAARGKPRRFHGRAYTILASANLTPWQAVSFRVSGAALVDAYHARDVRIVRAEAVMSASVANAQWMMRSGCLRSWFNSWPRASMGMPIPSAVILGAAPTA